MTTGRGTPPYEWRVDGPSHGFVLETGPSNVAWLVGEPGDGLEASIRVEVTDAEGALGSASVDLELEGSPQWVVSTDGDALSFEDLCGAEAAISLDLPGQLERSTADLGWLGVQTATGARQQSWRIDLRAASPSLELVYEVDGPTFVSPIPVSPSGWMAINQQDSLRFVRPNGTLTEDFFRPDFAALEASLADPFRVLIATFDGNEGEVLLLDPADGTSSELRADLLGADFGPDSQLVIGLESGVEIITPDGSRRSIEGDIASSSNLNAPRNSWLLEAVEDAEGQGTGAVFHPLRDGFRTSSFDFDLPGGSINRAAWSSDAAFVAVSRFDDVAAALQLVDGALVPVGPSIELGRGGRVDGAAVRGPVFFVQEFEGTERVARGFYATPDGIEALTAPELGALTPSGRFGLREDGRVGDMFGTDSVPGGPLRRTISPGEAFLIGTTNEDEQLLTVRRLDELEVRLAVPDRLVAFIDREL